MTQLTSLAKKLSNAESDDARGKERRPTSWIAEAPRGHRHRPTVVAHRRQPAAAALSRRQSGHPPWLLSGEGSWRRRIERESTAPPPPATGGQNPSGAEELRRQRSRSTRFETWSLRRRLESMAFQIPIPMHSVINRFDLLVLFGQEVNEMRAVWLES